MKYTLVGIAMLLVTACGNSVTNAELDGYDCAYAKNYSIGRTSYSCRQECQKLQETAEKQACFKGVRDGEADKKASTL